MSQEHLPGSLDDTDSHDLVRTETGDSALATNVRNHPNPPEIKYRPSSRTLEETLAEGLSNEDLWMLIRRFNKQIYYVKAAEEAPQKALDLNRAEDEKYPPEKLRITLERFYTSVIIGFSSFFNHIGRLRSWKEPRRTAKFCAFYFVAWLVDLLIPALSGVLIALIIFSPVRSSLFPEPAEPDAKPGQHESHDSITGVSEEHKGEAAEQEASNLVNMVATVAVEGAAGKYGQGVAESSTETLAEGIPEAPSMPGSTEVVPVTTEAPGENAPAEDKTEKPMKKKVYKATNQTMRVISDITDLYERFANVFSPTPPFFAISARLQLVGILVSICFASYVTSSYMIVKGIGFAIGFGFFGDPVFEWTMDFLNRKVPNWKDHLDMQKTLLKGVPTNAQLTLTLLRIGEMNSSPLPPPPGSSNIEPSWPISRKKSNSSNNLITNGDNNNNNGSTQDLSSTLQKQPSADSLEPPKPSKRRWLTKLFKIFRRTITTAIQSHIALDRAMAIAGSAHTQNLLGMLQRKGFITAPMGPLKFEAKFERKRGTVVIDSSKEPPLLYFTTQNSGALDDLRIENQKDSKVLFQIPVTEIRELKKTEGLGWKGKLIVELTVKSKEVADGLVVCGREVGQCYHLTGMKGRNQLFNRLVAIDAQFWESY
ncbi:uncharacterized protein EURHEDRAFT_373989 [Aspergillus ruber CBS 135680]|uniref:Uncharacterized protein n=1 Tax=Aspergillus ruber (strain CBS 135680) TaxID=1388766 RepID=A0A017SPJ9_ASPRC|nr:uncharacterized protein EURHEDRAFT_373989 [Aspergillus ruber CBS 135680]EYE98908.1 hypothetical protein EURHEDRAFT_373989 [Aspergillus ruber CBS 135680]